MQAQVPQINSLLTQFPELKAVLWDMDGTIVNTERYHLKSIEKLILDNPGEIAFSDTEFEAFCLGNTDEIVFQSLLKSKAISNINLEQFLQEKEAIFQNLIKQADFQEYLDPDIKILIQEIHQKNIPQIVVTSSEKETAEFMLHLTELYDYFNFVITRKDTTENKPSPQPYLLAMEKLNLNADHVLIFEDSPTGLKAAQASGANFIAAGWYSL